MKNCALARSYFSRNVVALLVIGLHKIRPWTSVAGFKNLAKLDDNNFIIRGKIIDCDDVFVRSSRPFTGVGGLSGVLVIATDDAVLIGHKDKT